MKKWILLSVVAALLIFGGVLIDNQVRADAAGTPESSIFYGMGRWMGFGAFERGCWDNDGDRGFGMMGGYYNNTQESDETYYMLFPVVDGEDYLAGITFHVQVKDIDGVVVFEDDLVSNPAGALGVWLTNDFEGTITVTYGDLTGTESVAQDNDSTWCLAEQVVITLE